MTSPRPFKVLFAGGGTGGHLYPGLAIAEEFQRRVAGVRVEWAGSSYGLEARVIPQKGFVLHLLPVRGLYGVSWLKRLKVALLLPAAFLQCVWVLLRFRPHLVVGVGGYASGPMLAAAVVLGRVTVLQEQNAYPGMTNRILGRWVRRAFVPVAGLERIFPRAEVVGNPVRRDILALRETPRPRPHPPQVLVLGGSQGARVINRAMMDALPLLARWGHPVRVVHQAGPQQLEQVTQGYQGCTIPHQVVPFLEDMAGALAASRVAVSRAGASAVAELITARLPSVLIPIPGTSGDHQLKNGRRVEQHGAGVVLEQHLLTGQTLAARLMDLLDHPEKLDRMEACSDSLFPGDSARRIVESCLELTGRSPGKE
ncbi:MAG: undecaprenyldiphospho-muramoylpentapeptide beta-N-acetylglucosaminyltransferase [Deltaproteobacteria bacterium]|nr:undecaprenyldiphospho-muramoylpentapeptide beta-N-acetylglucosaminyltransferase [Deltaproteobacteria bacterium]